MMRDFKSDLWLEYFGEKLVQPSDLGKKKKSKK